MLCLSSLGDSVIYSPVLNCAGTAGLHSPHCIQCCWGGSWKSLQNQKIYFPFPRVTLQSSPWGFSDLRCWHKFRKSCVELSSPGKELGCSVYCCNPALSQAQSPPYSALPLSKKIPPPKCLPITLSQPLCCLTQPYLGQPAVGWDMTQLGSVKIVPLVVFNLSRPRTLTLPFSVSLIFNVPLPSISHCMLSSTTNCEWCYLVLPLLCQAAERRYVAF